MRTVSWGEVEGARSRRPRTRLDIRLGDVEGARSRRLRARVGTRLWVVCGYGPSGAGGCRVGCLRVRRDEADSP